jgi:diadenosine tetraphosphate (Ap4A) HIT family hydrolase
VDSVLPGYLMVGSRQETTHLFDLSPRALAELGPLLSLLEQALFEILGPERVYIGRYGHSPGHSIHFHVIPVCPWVAAAFKADSRYKVFESLYPPGASTSAPDGGELTTYVWREFCESKTPPPIQGSSVMRWCLFCEIESIHCWNRCGRLWMVQPTYSKSATVIA